MTRYVLVIDTREDDTNNVALHSFTPRWLVHIGWSGEINDPPFLSGSDGPYAKHVRPIDVTQDQFDALLMARHHLDVDAWRRFAKRLVGYPESVR